MLLYKNLVIKIQNKLKQPYNVVNLELSCSLNSGEKFCCIDQYLKNYLLKICKYKINSKCEVLHSELNVSKYLYNRGARNYDINIFKKYKSYLKFVKKYIILIQENYDRDIGFILNGAIRLGQYKIVKFLIKNNYELFDQSEDYYGKCSREIYYLEESIINNNLKIYKYLVKKYFKIIINSADDSDINSFYVNIALSHKFNFVKKLIKKGLKFIDTQDTLLREAIEEQNYPFFIFLTKSGADKNIALKIACEYLNLEMIKLLVRNGAYVEEKVGLEYAILEDDLDIYKFFSKTVPSERNVIMACHYGSCKIVKYLIENNLYDKQNILSYSSIKVLYYLNKHNLVENQICDKLVKIKFKQDLIEDIPIIYEYKKERESYI